MVNDLQLNMRIISIQNDVARVLAGSGTYRFVSLKDPNRLLKTTRFDIKFKNFGHYCNLPLSITKEKN